jgi:hypothetical protein
MWQKESRKKEIAGYQIYLMGSLNKVPLSRPNFAFFAQPRRAIRGVCGSAGQWFELSVCCLLATPLAAWRAN